MRYCDESYVGTPLKSQLISRLIRVLRIYLNWAWRLLSRITVLLHEAALVTTEAFMTILRSVEQGRGRLPTCQGRGI
jgi:hypothetical protein